MPDKPSDAIGYLTERVRFLQGQLDKSVLIEASLIATLKELLPGFGPRFDQVYKAAESAIVQNDAQVAATLLRDRNRKPQ